MPFLVYVSLVRADWLPQKRLAFSQNTPIDDHQALLFITVYSRLQWGHRLVARSSQHVLLSSQTLGDLTEALPCISNEMPDEHVDEQGATTWQKSTAPSASGCVMCLEGILYGDGQSESDYSEYVVDISHAYSTHVLPCSKLLAYLRGMHKELELPVTQGAHLHDVPLNTLKIHLHQPYWMMHRGDCEHFVVVEQIRCVFPLFVISTPCQLRCPGIRLRHPSDPALADYPLTTQITPPLLDVCRACNKVPAVYSILGDIRLGESPFMICAPCWRWMGAPTGPDAHQITVVPLP